jgi:hypothetical protein
VGRRTDGRPRYYGRPPAEREGFKRRLRLHAVLLAPILWLNGRLAKMDFRRASMSYKGVAGPAGSCTPETFARAEQVSALPRRHLRRHPDEVRDYVDAARGL